MKKHLFLFLIALAICINHQTASAQTSRNGNWIAYIGNNSFAKRYNVWNEVQYRNYNLIGDLQQLIARVGVGYHLTEGNNNVLLGYALIHSERYTATGDKAATTEHRIFQQFITKQQFGRMYLQHRYRVEERFFTDKKQLRFRYLLGLNIPLNKKTMSQGAWYVSVFDELFINGESPRFDRNRMYGALGYQIRPRLRAELGFLAQGVESDQRGQLQVMFFNQLPVRKAKTK
jgi:Protein of unknown function (DUF2490)